MLISVFTPTYNRADLIHRVFDSLNAQSYRKFEWIVVDDGSTDDTLSVLEKFSSIADFKIKVRHQENQGKSRSINAGLNLASGDLFVCFDSDDWCQPNALSRIVEVWDSLSLQERNFYCGISCLKVFPSGELVGEDYSRMRLKGESYIDRFNKRIKGDKWEILRTDVHRRNVYDLFPGERYIAPEYAWLKMGKNYKTLFLNEALSIVEYQDEGISKNNLFHRVSSPFSTAHFYFLALKVSSGWGNRSKSAVNCARFCFHAKNKRAVTSFCFLFRVMGFVFYCRDRLELKSRLVRKRK